MNKILWHLTQCNFNTVLVYHEIRIQYARDFNKHATPSGVNGHYHVIMV